MSRSRSSSTSLSSCPSQPLWLADSCELAAFGIGPAHVSSDDDDEVQADDEEEMEDDE
jgi:hypothetical protein